MGEEKKERLVTPTEDIGEERREGGETEGNRKSSEGAGRGRRLLTDRCDGVLCGW